MSLREWLLRPTIRIGAERIAQSLVNDDWFWHSGCEDQRLVRRGGMKLSVSLKGEVRTGDGVVLPNNIVPLNRSERRMLAREAESKLQVTLVGIANAPFVGRLSGEGLSR